MPKTPGRRKRKNEPDRNLIKRGNVWWIDYRDPDGKRIRQSLKTSNKQQAMRRIGVMRGRPAISYSENPLLELLERYLAESKFTESTRRGTGDALRLFLAGKTDTTDLTPEDAQECYDALQESRSEATARTYSGRAHAFLVWLHHLDFIAWSPAKVVYGDREIQKRRGVVDTATATKLIRFSKRDDMRFVLWCGLFAGMRRSEIVMARPAWFDLQARQIHIPAKETTQTLGRSWNWQTKNKYARRIPLRKDFAGFLRGFLDWDAAFCIHPKAVGKNLRWDPRRPFEELIKAFRRKNPEALPRDFSMHSMRHSFISNMARNKKFSLGQISKWSGDRIRTIEENYIEEIIEGDELDDL
jgi:integrase